MKYSPVRSLRVAVSAAIWGSLATPALHAQIGLDIRLADPIEFSGIFDSNTATFWRDGKLHLYTSAGEPLLHRFSEDLQHRTTERVVLLIDAIICRCGSNRSGRTATALSTPGITTSGSACVRPRI